MNRAIVRRWWDILMLSLLGMAVGCLLLDWQCSPCKIVAQSLGELSHWWVQIAAIILFCATVAKAYLHLSPFSPGHVRFMLRYPPTWFAVLLAGIFVYGLEQVGWVGGNRCRYDTGIWRMAGFAVLVGCFLLTAMQGAGCLLLTAIQGIANHTVHSDPKESFPAAYANAASSSSPSTGLSGIAEDWEALKQWFATDSPITCHAEDRFNRAALVRRLADRLLLPFSQGVAIGLIGYYGSGKTSVVKLTQEEIAARRTNGTLSVIFCDVDCWGFEDSGAARQNVLVRVIAELSKHVDCLAISQLPESYRNLLAGGGGWWASFARFTGDSNPQAQLERLTPILEAMNTRLVLAIEELDRPQSNHFHPQDIEATLHCLKSVGGTSFILAGSKNAKYHIGFTKLCDYIEEI